MSQLAHRKYIELLVVINTFGMIFLLQVKKSFATSLKPRDGTQVNVHYRCLAL